MDQLARSGPALGSNPGLHQGFIGMDQAPQIGPVFAPIASAPSNWVDQFSGLKMNGGPLHDRAPARYAGTPSHYAGVPARQDAFSAYDRISVPFAGYASQPAPFPTFSSAFPGNLVREPQPSGPQEVEALKAREEAFLAAYRAFEEVGLGELGQNHQSAHAESDQKPDSAQMHVDLSEAQVQPEVEGKSEAEQGDISQLSERERQQDELARAATSILGTVASNEDPKFKNSTFIETMRRIASYRVVLDNNDLIDTETGESVVLRPPDGAENGMVVEQDLAVEAEGKGKQRLDLSRGYPPPESRPVPE